MVEKDAHVPTLPFVIYAATTVLLESHFIHYIICSLLLLLFILKSLSTTIHIKNDDNEIVCFGNFKTFIFHFYLVLSNSLHNVDNDLMNNKKCHKDIVILPHLYMHLLLLFKAQTCLH